MEKKQLNKHLKVEQDIYVNSSPPGVWFALTNPLIIKKYLFGTDTETTWEPGTSVVFSGEWEGQTYRDHGTVLENKENEVLSYSYWSAFSGLEDQPENYSVIRFELSPEGAGTRLKIIQKGYASEENRDHSVGTWAETLEQLRKVTEE